MIRFCSYTDEWEKWWKNPDQVEYFEFMGKDNVPFHSVIFPACQLGTGERWTKVNRLMATEYLNYEDTKFSKSRGIGVFGHHARETSIPSDIWRFYLIYTRPENQDSAFKWDDVLLKTNSELLGNLGNFLNRALKFCKDNFGGRVGVIRLSAEDQQFVALVSRHTGRYVDLLEDAREREAVMEMLNVSRLGNQLMQANKPWKLNKSEREADRVRAASVVGLCVNTAALLSMLMEPFMPAMASKLWSQLGVKRSDLPLLDKQFRCLLRPGHKIGTPEPLVREIKMDEMKTLQERFAGTKQGNPPKPAATTTTTLKANGPVLTNGTISNGLCDPQKVAALEKEVSAQGEVVRQLKTAKSDKEAIKKEVDKLLELKKELTVASGASISNNNKREGKKGGGGKGKKK